MKILIVQISTILFACLTMSVCAFFSLQLATANSREIHRAVCTCTCSLQNVERVQRWVAGTLAVERNEILLIDVRHLPRHLLLPPSETVYNETPAVWRINHRHMRRCWLSSSLPASQRIASPVRNHRDGLLSLQYYSQD